MQSIRQSRYKPLPKLPHSPPCPFPAGPKRIPLSPQTGFIFSLLQRTWLTAKPRHGTTRSSLAVGNPFPTNCTRRLFRLPNLKRKFSDLQILLALSPIKSYSLHHLRFYPLHWALLRDNSCARRTSRLLLFRFLPTNLLKRR